MLTALDSQQKLSNFDHSKTTDIIRKRIIKTKVTLVHHTTAVSSQSWWNYLGNWIIIQNSYIIQKGQAQKILSIEMSIVYLTLKMNEFVWLDKFRATIFYHLTAVVANKMTDLLSPWILKEISQNLFFLKQSPKLFGTQAYLHTFPPTPHPLHPCAVAFALLQAQFIKMNRVLLKLPHQ